MRDPNRIDDFCKTLATIWKTQCPDWRFGQLICNVFGTHTEDPWWLEEDEMMQWFEQYFGIEIHDDVAT